MYKYDQTLLKVFGSGEDKKIKLVRMNCLKTSGLEVDKKYKVVRGEQNDSKIIESVLRSKSKFLSNNIYFNILLINKIMIEMCID